MRGGERAPPPSQARTDFTLITECTPESSGCYSVYSVELPILQRHRVRTTEYTQSGNGRPLSGVHSIMMEKLAQAGEDGGARPPPFTLSTITYKVVVYTFS
jgi:hypothetical protein